MKQERVGIHIRLTDEEAYMLEAIIEATLTTKTGLFRRLLRHEYKELEKEGVL